MAETPKTTIRIPLHLKNEIRKRTDNLSRWVIEVIRAKLDKDNT